MASVSRPTTLVLASSAAARLATTTMAERRGNTQGRHGGGSAMMSDFAAMDADSEGKITPAEIEACRTAGMTAADTAKDGFRNADKLSAMSVALVADRATARAAEMSGRMMKRQDAGGDGKPCMSEMAPRTGQERLFQRVDTDQDGALRMAELTAAKDRMAERKGQTGRHAWQPACQGRNERSRQRSSLDTRGPGGAGFRGARA